MAQTTNPPRVALNDIALCVRDAKGLYQAMVDNSYIMPKFKSSICTMDFMYEMQTNKIFSLKWETYKQPRKVQRPPQIESIMEKLNTAIEVEACVNIQGVRAQQLLGLQEHLKKRAADKEWLLVLLYNFRPNDEIFQKGYAYFRPTKKSNRNEIAVLPAPNDFYEGLAQLPVR